MQQQRRLQSRAAREPQLDEQPTLLSLGPRRLLAMVGQGDSGRSDIASRYKALLAESRRAGPAWDIVFVAALSGSAGRSPTSTEAEAPLQRMVESIKSGRIGSFIPFDIHGQPVSFG